MLRLYVTASEALNKLKADTSGATAIEYGLLAAGNGSLVTEHLMSGNGADCVRTFAAISVRRVFGFG